MSDWDDWSGPDPDYEQENEGEASVPPARNSPLRVERSSPSGRTSQYTFITLTFNNPMIPLASISQIDTLLPPGLTIEPPVEGTWRWESPRILKFRPTDNFEIDTQYSVTLPATTSTIEADRGTDFESNPIVFSREFKMKFKTQVPRIDSCYPQSNINPAKLLFMIRFGLNVDSEKYFSKGFIRLFPSEDCPEDDEDLAEGEATRETGIPLRLASREEVETLVLRDEEFILQRKLCYDYSSMKDSCESTSYRQRTIWVIPVNPETDFPPPGVKKEFVLIIGKRRYNLSTYGPLEYSNHHPDTTNRRADTQNCRSFEFRFSNPLIRDPDDSKITPIEVSVDPEVEPDFRLDRVWEDGVRKTVKTEVDRMNVSSGCFRYYGHMVGDTTYTVTLSNIRDCFGQTLPDVTETFEIKPLRYRLRCEYPDVSTIDSTTEKKQYYSVNVLNISHIQMKVYRFQPLAHDKWSSYYEVKGDLLKFCELVFDEEIETGAELDKWSAFNCWIRPEFLQDPMRRLGHIVVECQPTQFLSDTGYSSVRETHSRNWFQWTQHSVSVFSFAERMLYAMVNTFDGNLVDAPVRFTDQRDEEIASKRLDDGHLYQILDHLDGRINGFFAHISLPETETEHAVFIDYVYPQDTGWKPDKNCLKFFMFDDRKTYRPGAQVNIKGMIRKLILREDSPTYDVVFPDISTRATYTLKDARATQLLEGEIRLSTQAAFDFVLQLPEGDKMNLGDCCLHLRYMEVSHTHRFTVQEFRVPKFLVSLNVGKQVAVSEGVLFDEFLPMKVSAKYSEGGAVQDASVDWKFRTEKAHVSPKPGYSFRMVKESRKKRYGSRRGEFSWSSFSGKTNEIGQHELPMSVKKVHSRCGGYSRSMHEIMEEFAEYALPERMFAKVAVTDVDQATISASTSVFVHSSSIYVGIRCRKNRLAPCEAIPVEIIVTDWNGFVQVGVNIECIIKSKVPVADIHRFTFESQEKPVNLTDFLEEIQLENPGAYEVFARIQDSLGHFHVCSTGITIVGEGEARLDTIEKRALVLTPNADSYSEGETAKILVAAPFDEGTESCGVLFAACSRVVHATTFRVAAEAKNMTVLDVPVLAGFLPNVSVRVLMYGRSFSKKYTRDLPSYAEGQCSLDVALTARELVIEVIPSDHEMLPGAAGEVLVRLASGGSKRRAPTDVTVVIVDLAHLSLKDYDLSNPLSLFYPKTSGARCTTYDLRTGIYMRKVAEEGEEEEEEEMMEESRGMAQYCMMGRSGSRNGPPAPPPAFRKNFAPLALFSPNLRLGPNGEVRVPFTLPDSLTTWKIWALVTQGSEFFGLGKSEIVASLPFSIKPSLPRFVNFADEADLTSVVFNRTKSPLDVVVNCSVSGSLDSFGEVSKELHLGSGNKEKVTFRVKAARIGESVVRLLATQKGGGASDGVEEPLEVLRPASAEAFADYGEIDATSETFIRTVARPEGCIPDFGGIDISLSSTAVGKLTDCFLYLWDYQFDCSEQSASRVLAIVALADILRRFNVPHMPAKSEITKVVTSSITNFQNCQKADGGFGYWPSSEHSSPYVSLYVFLCLSKLKAQRQYPVQGDLWNRIQAYAMNFVDRVKDYGARSQLSLRAFAVYVLSQTPGTLTPDEKASVLAQAREILVSSNRATEGNELSLEGMAWILMPIVMLSEGHLDDPDAQTILNHLNSNVNETAATANFITGYAGGEGKLILLHSDRRTDGTILDVLCRLKPDTMTGLIPKIVKGLLASRVKGRWSNTQENCYILLAMKSYFDAYESIEPDFGVSYEWGKDPEAGQIVGQASFKGRWAKSTNFHVPMPEVEADGSKHLELTKSGAGRLYWRVGLKYSPADLQLDALERGFIVEKDYEALEGGFARKLDDGHWEFSLGALIRVKLRISTETRRYHVAIVENLPAGCEAVNPDMPTSQVVPDDPEMGHCWWVAHRDFRDSRVEVFTRGQLNEGSYYYSFAMKCTSTGHFVVPPTHVEEMYCPEVFGRSKTEWVNVVE